MKSTLMAAAIALAVASPTLAANLVTNGSFETGDFTGWTQFGDVSFTGVASGNFDVFNPTDGIYQAYFGPVNGFGGISQAVGTAGTAYHVSFDLGNDNGLGSSVDFGGVNLLTNVPNGDYKHYNFVVTAADGSGLSFNFYNPPAYYALDNVSVAVPEASTWVMLIAGFGLVGAAARRRKALAA